MAAVTVKTDATVIDGGDLAHPWVPSKLVIVAEHGALLKLSMMDRRFAAFCGAPLHAAHPIEGLWVPEGLAQGTRGCDVGRAER